MAGYAVVFVPETKGVPLESIYMLFEGNIVKGAIGDTVPRHARARGLKDVSNVDDGGKDGDGGGGEQRGGKGVVGVGVVHVEDSGKRGV